MLPLSVTDILLPESELILTLDRLGHLYVLNTSITVLILYSSNTSAVLQDPSVAASPIEKRVAFLQSKNLTKEEIDVALARAGEDPSTAAAAVTASSGYQSAPQQAVYRPPPPPAAGYGYPPYGQWQAPPE